MESLSSFKVLRGWDSLVQAGIHRDVLCQQCAWITAELVPNSGLPWWLSSAYNVGDLDLIPGLGRSPGEGDGYPLQYSGLENSMDCIVQGDAKSQTWLRDLRSLGFLGGSNGKESTCNAGDPDSILGSGRFPWSRKWHLSPVFLPGESHGQRSMESYNP